MADTRSADRIIFGLFEPQTPLRPILDRLREMNFPEEAVELSSATPIMAQPAGVGWKRFRLVHVTMIAGAVGILFGFLLAGGTALYYPLRTGAKPIVSPSIVGIISYEMMMLFAIVTTFITMVVKVLRSHRAKAGYDPRIDEGFIGMSVRIDRGDARLRSVQDLFQEAGAVELEVQ